MKCNVCGAEMPSDSLFCGECGSKCEITEMIKQEDTKSSHKMGVIKILSAVAAVIVIGSFIAVGAFSGGNKNLYIEELYTVECDSETRFYKDSGEYDVFDYDDIYTTYSLDHSTAAFYDEDYALIIYREGEFTEIEEDVYTYYLSQDGKKIAYLIEPDDMNAELYVYDVESKESALISDEAFLFEDFEEYYYSHNVVFSPDGKYISFIADYDPDDGDFYSYICEIGKEPEEYKKNTIIVGMSNNKRLIYNAKYDKEDYVFDLYVNKKEDSVKLISNASYLYLIFNKDQTQAIFHKNENTYITEDGQDEVKLDNKSLYTAWSNIAYEQLSLLDQIEIELSGYADLTKAVYRGEDSLYGINSENEADRIAKGVVYFTISKDNRSIIFIEDESIVMIKDISKGEEVELETKDPVVEYYATENLDTIYYLTNEDELYLYDKKESIKVGDELDVVVINEKTGVLYYLSDQELYKVNGSETEKISMEDDVLGIEIVNNIAIAEVEDGDEIAYYHSVDDGPFEYQYSED